jgi:hypothetical protein
MLDEDEVLGAPRLRSGAGDIASEAWPAAKFKPAPFRAAYWRASNRSAGGILLTERSHLACPHSMLIKIARDYAARVGLLLGGGQIVVIDSDGRDLVTMETPAS